MAGVAKAGFKTLETYVDAKVRPRLTPRGNERTLRHRNELKEATYLALLGAPPTINDPNHGLIHSAAWFLRHRRNCFHVENDKSLSAHPWITSLRAVLPVDSRARIAAEARASAEETVGQILARYTAPDADQFERAENFDGSLVVNALYTGLGEEAVTEKLVSSILPASSTLATAAALTVVKAVLLDPSGENMAAVRDMSATVTAPLFDRVLYVAQQMLHRSGWCEILVSMDELQPHSRRRVGHKRMHYSNKPGSCYFVATHVSRVVTHFHAEELFRLYMTPRTPLAIDIYPSGVPVRVSQGAAVSGNLVMDPLPTWTDFVAHLSKKERSAPKKKKSAAQAAYGYVDMDDVDDMDDVNEFGSGSSLGAALASDDFPTPAGGKGGSQGGGGKGGKSGGGGGGKGGGKGGGEGGDEGGGEADAESDAAD
eukprot:3180261-Prymnesium_polylepis.1